MLGTYGIIRRMMRNWESPSAHPAYRYFRDHIDLPFPLVATVIGEIRKRSRWLWAFVGLIVLWMLGQIMFQARWQQFITTTCTAILLAPLIIAILAIYFLARFGCRAYQRHHRCRTRTPNVGHPANGNFQNGDDAVLARLARLLRYVNPFARSRRVSTSC